MATFYNQATLSYAGRSVNSNIATGELRDAAVLTKTAVSASYTPGGSITYVISLINSGAAPLSALTLSDDLGGYEYETQTLYPLSYVDGSMLYFLDGVQQSAPTVTAGPPMTVSGLNIPVGANAMLIYEARVTAYAPLGEDEEISNTVTVSGGGIATALTASAQVPMEMEPQLAVAKSMSPDSVVDGGEITYTFLLQNSGGATEATDDVALTDTFDPLLTDLTVTLDGQTLTAADYAYDETTGEFSTNSGQISVPAATFEQNADGSWTTTPGTAVLTVTGTI